MTYNCLTRNFIAAGIVVALCSLTGCGYDGDRQTTILPDSIRLCPGDVVLRRGFGFTSHAVLVADRGGGYSHVGIVVDSAGAMMVVHAVPDEPDYDGDADRVKMDIPTRFYAPENAETGRVMRCKDSTAAARAALVAMRVYARGTLFDHDYDDRLQTGRNATGDRSPAQFLHTGHADRKCDTSVRLHVVATFVQCDMFLGLRAY